MIARAFPPSPWLSDCSGADRAALVEAGLVGIVESLRCSIVPPVNFVSLSLPDFADRIVRARADGSLVISLGTIAQTVQRAAALAAGSTEFLTTGPLDRAQLAARIRLLCRGHALPASLALDSRTRQLTVEGAKYRLGDRELALVQALLAVRGGYVTHEALLKAVWQGRYDDRQHLRVAINRLRRRIEPEPDMPRYLLSEPAIGYRIGCPA